MRRRDPSTPRANASSRDGCIEVAINYLADLAPPGGEGRSARHRRQRLEAARSATLSSVADPTDEKEVAAFSRISPTAMLLAYFRTFTDIPFAAELAAATDAEAVSRALIEGSGLRLEDSRLNAPFAEARNK